MRVDAVLVAVAAVALPACPTRRVAVATSADMPQPTIQLGACGEPGRDGVMGPSPSVERADRDLDRDGKPETVVFDRKLCTPEGNCYWNVFLSRRDGGCVRYAGTFAGAALEVMASTGEDQMVDVRGYWNLHGGRVSLESYRFLRGGYLRVEALICRRDAADHKLECLDDGR